MLEIKGIKCIKKIAWYEIVPGMILLGGVKINDQVPPELVGFPILSPELLREIQDKYHLLKTHEILVAQCTPGANARQLSLDIKQRNEQVNKINIFRKEFFKAKHKIFSALGMDTAVPIIGSAQVEQDYLVKDTYSSFTVPYNRLNTAIPIPSFLNRIELSLTIGDLLTNKINAKFNLPNDQEVLLHLVADYSRSMHSAEKLELVVSAFNFFSRYILSFLANTKIRYYAFSQECRPVNFPLSGKEMKGDETNYASFIKKILHYKSKDVHNKVILFTDGEPSDQAEALQLARLFKKHNIDYTQIIFVCDRDLRFEIDPGEAARRGIKIVDNTAELPPDMHSRELTGRELAEKKTRIFTNYTAFAAACGGNQVLLKISELAQIITVECYDRYLGLLTLATTAQTAAISREITGAAQKKQPHPNNAPPEKKVTQWKDWYAQKKDKP